jgi:hypothetical protein
MRILFDRNVEPRYIDAIAATEWAVTERVDDHFAQTAPDRRVARYAEEHDMVVLTRDDDFFRLVRGRYDCGLLFFHQKHATNPSHLVAAIDNIRTSYTGYSEIEEGLPGNWV